MYTRCPECKTLFSLSDAQRKARGGLVRCGRCSAVFQSNDALLDRLPTEDDSGTSDTKVLAGKRTGGTPPKPKQKPAGAADVEFPLLNAARRPRTRLPFWILGNVLLVLVLAAQLLYFYSPMVAAIYPPMDPYVSKACRWLGCSTRPRQNVALIDLVKAQVSPHPKYDNALRVTATLVNRASFVQPYPLLEVTLSDNSGVALARRTFRPDEYLDKAQLGSGLPPHVAVKVSFDVTSPDPRAVGYEIELFAAP